MKKEINKKTDHDKIMEFDNKICEAINLANNNKIIPALVVGIMQMHVNAIGVKSCLAQAEMMEKNK